MNNKTISLIHAWIREVLDIVGLAWLHPIPRFHIELSGTYYEMFMLEAIAMADYFEDSWFFGEPQLRGIKIIMGDETRIVFHEPTRNGRLSAVEEPEYI